MNIQYRKTKLTKPSGILYKANHVSLHSVVCAVCIALLAIPISAHDGATGIIKHRMDSMKSLRDASKSVGNMFKGKTDYDVNAMRSASETFIKHGEVMPSQFPDTTESREGHETEALPVIWENWDEFTALADKFTQDSRAFDAIVVELQALPKLDKDSIRTARTAFFKAVKNCSGCHEQFRAE